MSDQEKILKAARGKKSKLNNIEKKWEWSRFPIGNICKPPWLLSKKNELTIKKL